MKKSNSLIGRPVLVLDIHRGIYFGYYAGAENSGRTVKLTGARHCFYYPVAKAGSRGVYGLAVVGPGDGAKIGPRVTMTIHDVSKIVDCDKKAVDAWEKASW